VWLTNDHVRVAVDLIAEANYKCVDIESCGKNCQKCLRYSRTCVAPIVSASRTSASLIDNAEYKVG
jgi:hypothetical protein